MTVVVVWVPGWRLLPIRGSASIANAPAINKLWLIDLTTIREFELCSPQGCVRTEEREARRQPCRVATGHPVGRANTKAAPLRGRICIGVSAAR